MGDCESLKVQVIFFDNRSTGTIRAGFTPSVVVHTAMVPCVFDELLAKIDRKTREETETNPESAKAGDVVSVRLRPMEKVCIETFEQYAPLGRLMIRDHDQTIAVAVVQEVTKKPIPKVRSASEND